MEIKQTDAAAHGIKFCIEDNGKEIARAYLYIMRNELRKQPFGFMEDVYVDEAYRGQGLGTRIVEQLIKTAKEYNCYKIVATSRHSKPKVHALYERIGFENFSVGFKMYLEEE